MGRILVLADDFTGAAEIAGIGSRFGLDVEIIRKAPFDSAARLLVVDTDSRSLAPAQAAQRVAEFFHQVPIQRFELIFKKIDSLLRGPVIAEIEAAQRVLGRHKVILAPANPSRGRTIANGEYRIDGVPLHETTLANDPEYPRRSSKIEHLIGPLPRSITLADTTTDADVGAWSERVSSETLPVGAADFFGALLTHRGLSPVESRVTLGPGPILMVCGSAAESSRRAVQLAATGGVPVISLPDSLDDWAPAIGHALAQKSCAIATTGASPLESSPSVSVAKAVANVLNTREVGELLIEGGATAAAILGEMKWYRFAQCHELAPGVVRMNVSGSSLHITAKPGSYPWPGEVWNALVRLSRISSDA